MPAKWRNYVAGVSPTTPAGRKWRKSSPNTFIGFAASRQKGFGTLEFDACALPQSRHCPTLDFQGNVAQQALPNIDFGTSTERFDVNDVLEGM